MSSPQSIGLRAALAPVTALLLGTCLLYVGSGLQAILVPLRADVEGFGRLAIGLFGSGYYLGFVLGCLFAPFLILRAGHIRAFATLMACLSAAVLAFPLLIGTAQWLLFRVVIGLCFSGLLVIVESWLNEKSSNETRGVVMSAYTVVTFGSIVIGQLAVATMPLDGFAIFSLCSIVLSLAAVPVALTRASQPAPIPVVAFRPLRLFQTAPAGFAGVFTCGFMSGSVFALGPIFAVDVGFGQGEAAVFVSAIVLGGAIGQYPFGRLSDFVDRRLVLLGVMLATAALSVTTALSALGPETLILLAGFCYGLVMLPSYSLAAAHAFDWTATEDMVETSAGLILTFGVGSAIGPIIASVAMETMGPSSLFLLHACAALGLSAFIAIRLVARRRPAEEMRADFDIYSTSPTGAVLTPDAVSVDDAHMEAPAGYVPPEPDDPASEEEQDTQANAHEEGPRGPLSSPVPEPI